MSGSWMSHKAGCPKSWMSGRAGCPVAGCPIKLDVRKAGCPVAGCPKAECPKAECLSVAIAVLDMGEFSNKTYFEMTFQMLQLQYFI